MPKPLTTFIRWAKLCWLITINCTLHRENSSQPQNQEFPHFHLPLLLPRVLLLPLLSVAEEINTRMDAINYHRSSFFLLLPIPRLLSPLLPQERTKTIQRQMSSVKAFLLPFLPPPPFRFIKNQQQFLGQTVASNRPGRSINWNWDSYTRTERLLVMEMMMMMSGNKSFWSCGVILRNMSQTRRQYLSYSLTISVHFTIGG